MEKMIKIVVKVKSRSRKSKIEKIDEKYFLVWTKSPPKDGLANEETAMLLAKFLAVSPSQVILRKGYSSPFKIFEITK